MGSAALDKGYSLFKLLRIRLLVKGAPRQGKPRQAPSTTGRCPPPPTGVRSHQSQDPLGVGKRGWGSWALGLRTHSAPCPWAPDCFFQLGNLTFAEADYQQALALSPQDEGANIRMGLLQEKMGFCEHRSRCVTCGRDPVALGGGAWLEAACRDPGSRSSALPGKFL